MRIRAIQSIQGSAGCAILLGAMLLVSASCDVHNPAAFKTNAEKSRFIPLGQTANQHEEPGQMPKASASSRPGSKTGGKPVSPPRVVNPLTRPAETAGSAAGKN